MFMCEECHEPDQQKYHCYHLSGSHGKCECCGKTADCVDCRAYKYDPELINDAKAGIRY